MTLTTTILIGCAVGFFVSTVVGWSKVGTLKKEMEHDHELDNVQRELEERSKLMERVADDIFNRPTDESMHNPLYAVIKLQKIQLLNSDQAESSFHIIIDGESGRAVIKTLDGDETTRCVIKRFTDEDEAYNQLCAEELVEMLNEK